MNEAVARFPVPTKLYFLSGVGLLIAGLFSSLARPAQVEIQALLYTVGSLLATTPILAKKLARSKQTKITPSQTLIFLAVVGCLAAGSPQAAALVSIILILGHSLEELGSRRLGQPINEFPGTTGLTARKIVGEYVQKIDARSLSPGDYVEILPGEIIPSDGVITSGISKIDMSLITGETHAVNVSEGQQVYAGTINLSGLLVMQVSQAGPDTIVEQIKKTIESARETKSRVSAILERCAEYYTPGAIAFALLTLLYTLEPTRAVTVLISSIPCALFLSAPTAISATLAVLGKRGVHIKNIQSLDSAADVKCIVLGKIGGLFDNELEVTKFSCFDKAQEHKILSLAASLARCSSQRSGKAVCDFAGKLGIETLQATDVFEYPGKGISGYIDSHFVTLGSPEWLEEFGITPHQDADRITFDHTHLLRLTVDNFHKADLLLSSRLIPQLDDLAPLLGSLGVQKIVITTGSRQHVTHSLTEEMKVNAHREEFPSEDIIESISKNIKNYKPIMLVGQFAAPPDALDAAEIKIATPHLKKGSLAANNCDAILLSDRLDPILFLIKKAKQLRTTTNLNLLVALTFVALSMIFAALGTFGPVTAAIIHQTGAFFVIFNSARLLRMDLINKKPQTFT